MTEIPRRVSVQENGTYIWSAEPDMEVDRKNYRTGGKICLIAAFVFFVAGIILSVFNRSWQPALYMTAFSIIMSLITVGVVRGQESLGQRRRTYRLMDELIATGSGRWTAVFEFKNAKTTIMGKGYIELKGRTGAFRAYVPEEDFDFVRNYIQSRVPMGCEIRHAFWEQQGYSLRTNLNYRNKSLNEQIPTGE